MKPVLSLAAIVVVLEGVIGATPGTCPPGFVQCTNGMCEPYAGLCGTFTAKPSPTITSMVQRSTPAISTAHVASNPTHSDVTTVMSTTTEGTLSPPTDVTTVNLSYTSTTNSGPETCPHGFENCFDGKCEPFHFLCDEHSNANPAGTILG